MHPFHEPVGITDHLSRLLGIRFGVSQIICDSTGGLDFNSMISKDEWSIDDSTNTSKNCVDGEVRVFGDPSTGVIGFQWLYLSGELDSVGHLWKVSTDPDGPVATPALRVHAGK